MSRAFPVKSDDIKESCGSTSFQEGLDYFNAHKVSHLTFSPSDQMFKAIVYDGSKEYIVRVDLHKEEYIFASCTCAAYD
ncbi:MAG: hypothetical protein K0R67_3065, partial [Paenibacillus sp.]|nr:hypothetical protein [Paenibacillus sp.]